jgi:hypothetical protein
MADLHLFITGRSQLIMGLSILRCFFICCLIAHGTIYAQLNLRGMVMDSATLEPLPNVNIRLRNAFAGTITDQRGLFLISVSVNDTLNFSMVGYHSKLIPVRDIGQQPVIYLKQEYRLLNSIMVVPEIEIQGLPIIPPENPFQNPTYTKAYTDTPGVPNMQTFGPSVILKGLLTRYTKYERERRALPKLQQKNMIAKKYLEVVNDPALQKELMDLYNLTETDFYRLLTLFNEKYTDTVYELDPNELISLLRMFYAENARKK